jgi:hypothetical protein
MKPNLTALTTIAIASLFLGIAAVIGPGKSEDC